MYCIYTVYIYFKILGVLVRQKFDPNPEKTWSKIAPRIENMCYKNNIQFGDNYQSNFVQKFEKNNKKCQSMMPTVISI